MPNFPGNIDDDVSLFLAANNARTKLTSSISDSDLTIPVVTTSGFPNTGFLTILSDPDDITKAEAISYVGVTLTTFSGVLRGDGGTTATSHNSQDNVDLTVMAEHHNELKDAVIALETFVGITGAENFVPKDAQGNAIVSGTLTASVLTVTGTSDLQGDVDFKSNLTVSGIAQFETLNAITSLTVSGIPVSTGTGGAVGDFVARSGDSMTGDLDMTGNNVYNAGVVAMQDDTPIITTSGLLWFDTDASGHGERGSVNLLGGFLGSLIQATTGTTTTTDVWQTLGFNDILYENSEWFDISQPSRLTVPSGVTRVKLSSTFRYESNAAGDRRTQIFKNGNTDTATTAISGAVGVSVLHTASGTDHVQQTFTPVLPVIVGDYFEVRVHQTSGGNLDIDNQDNWFGIQAIDTRGVPGVNSVNLLQGDINFVPGTGINIIANSQTGEIEIVNSGGVGGSIDESQVALLSQVFGS